MKTMETLLRYLGYKLEALASEGREEALRRRAG